MKKDRNCMNYPIYPGVMPIPPQMYPNYPQSNNQINNDINNRISNLEKRVTRLESILNNNTNDSNFYMV